MRTVKKTVTETTYRIADGGYVVAGMYDVTGVRVTEVVDGPMLIQWLGYPLLDTGFRVDTDVVPITPFDDGCRAASTELLKELSVGLDV